MPRIMILALPMFLALSACLETDTQRGIVGVVGGAAVAGAMGANPLEGAAIGGAVGYLCSDLNVLGCRN